MNTLNQLPEIPEARGDDLHHIEYIHTSDLSLFMAGNQFMVMPALIAAFRRQHPDVARIYYQTLPPGLSLKQLGRSPLPRQGAHGRGVPPARRPVAHARVGGRGKNACRGSWRATLS